MKIPKKILLVDVTQQEVSLKYFMILNSIWSIPSFCNSNEPLRLNYSGLTIFMTNLPYGHLVDTVGFLWPIVDQITNQVLLYSLLWYLSK